VRFLIDEMFSPGVAARLDKADHDAVHVHDTGHTGVPDAEILAYAAEHGRVVVTGNAVDFIPLLDQRTAAGLPVTAVVVALKRTFPPGAGALEHALALRLDAWAARNPDPYRHVHWLGQ
jgi:predicted nuclease of predicted toxin-antitoxin system